MSNQSEVKDSDRRGFLRRLVGLTASAGVAGLVLDRLADRSALPNVQALTPMNVDIPNNGTGTTSLSSPGNPALTATNTGSGAALQGTCTAGTGVMGTTTTGTGVQGLASGSGTALAGFAGAISAIPIVAQGSSGQAANLQEWRNGSGITSAVDASGKLGIGTASPGFSIEGTGAAGATGFVVSSYGGGTFGFFDGRSARGSQSSPSATQMNDTLVEFGARGFGATAFSASRAAISMLAAENWTDTAQGTMLNFYTTGTGQSAPTQRMSISANGTVIVSGPVQATAFNTVSDMRFKEDIQPIDNALDMVLRLNGVYFKWNGLHHSRLKQSNAKERQVGLIAQQVQEVIPEAVSEWDAQGAKDYLAVDYNRLVAITIEAIKELKAENNKLLDKVTALERTMKELAGS